MKRALIIGGTSGIGKALAKVLLTENYKVAISGIPRDDLGSLKNEFGEMLSVQFIDCSKENCSDELSDLINKIGGLDLLVYSAGVAKMNKDQGFEIQNAANKVNVLGFTEVVDWGYRYFQKQGSGHLVGISSFAGLLGFRTSPAYTSAKGYQIKYLEAMRQKAHKSGAPIYVTDIRPGFVDTEISRELKKFWVATPEKAAKQIMNAIKRKQKVRYVTKRWRLLAPIVKLTPDFVRSRL